MMLAPGTHAPLLLAIALILPASEPLGKGLRNIEVGHAIPRFSVRRTDGTDVTNETYGGKVLIIVFARPEHEKSREVLRSAQQILEHGGEPKPAVLAVATKTGSEEYFKRIATEDGLTYPIAMDAERKMYGDFGLVVAPTTLVIDKAGTLRFVMPYMRAAHDRRLRAHVDLLLGTLSRAEYDKLLLPLDESKTAGQDPWTRRLGLGRTLADQGKFAEAVPLLTELHEERQEPAVALLLGTCLLELDRTDDAAKYLEPLVKNADASAKVKFALGRLEFRRANDDAAERLLTDALATSPTKGPILYHLGRLYERKGDLPKAVACYRKAAEEGLQLAP